MSLCQTLIKTQKLASCKPDCKSKSDSCATNYAKQEKTLIAKKKRVTVLTKQSASTNTLSIVETRITQPDMYEKSNRKRRSVSCSQVDNNVIYNYTNRIKPDYFQNWDPSMLYNESDAQSLASSDGSVVYMGTVESPVIDLTHSDENFIRYQEQHLTKRRKLNDTYFRDHAVKPSRGSTNINWNHMHHTITPQQYCAEYTVQNQGVEFDDRLIVSSVNAKCMALSEIDAFDDYLLNFHLDEQQSDPRTDLNQEDIAIIDQYVFPDDGAANNNFALNLQNSQFNRVNQTQY